jgi:hypothetical protein
MTIDLKLSKRVHYALRIAVAMCFIGHGAFGIIGKAIWCNYFAVFGVDTHLSYQLMPIVGGIDILFGIMMLVYPLRAIPLWLVVWGFVTALLRPLSGEPFAEFIERAGNFGAPLALLILGGFPKNIRQAFSPLNANVSVDAVTLARVTNCLRVIVFLLLVGHGGLNITEKKSLLDQYTALGFSNPGGVARLVGMAEVLSAFVILIKPVPQLVFLLFIWKMTSEMFYPHYEIFEFIERGGSYGSLLALWFLTRNNFSLKTLSSFNFSFKKFST